MGRHLAGLTDQPGLLRNAHLKGVPVFIPAFTDSELGIDFALHKIFRQRRGLPLLRYDPFEDFEKFANTDPLKPLFWGGPAPFS